MIGCYSLSLVLSLENTRAHSIPISCCVSDFWKHFVLSVATATYDRWKALQSSEALPPLYDLAVTIQPIVPENKGTWKELEKLLVLLAKDDRAALQRVLFDLARKNLTGLVTHLRKFDEFTTFSSALRDSYGDELVVEALLSHDDAVVTLGFALFDATGIAKIPMRQLLKAPDEAIAAVIFAFRMQPFYDEVISRFLLALLPRVNRGPAPLKELLTDEMIFQCKNLPGACLGSLKKASKGQPLVRRAIQQADAYFDNLRLIQRSAINSMEVAGLRRAMRLKAVRESRTMRAQIREKSVFSQVFSTSYLLYGGKKWRTFFGGQLGGESGMKEISHSAELPRMPSIDPDGMAQRLQNARRLRNQLISRIAGKQ
jgi:hypothetical protein